MSGKSKPENKLKRKKTEELETDTFPTDPPGKSFRVNFNAIIRFFKIGVIFCKLQNSKLSYLFVCILEDRHAVLLWENNFFCCC